MGKKEQVPALAIFVFVTAGFFVGVVGDSYNSEQVYERCKIVCLVPFTGAVASGAVFR